MEGNPSRLLYDKVSASSAGKLTGVAGSKPCQRARARCPSKAAPCPTLNAAEPDPETAWLHARAGTIGSGLTERAGRARRRGSRRSDRRPRASMRFLPIEDFDLGGPGEAASPIQIESMRHGEQRCGQPRNDRAAREQQGSPIHAEVNQLPCAKGKPHGRPRPCLREAAAGARDRTAPQWDCQPTPKITAASLAAGDRSTDRPDHLRCSRGPRVHAPGGPGTADERRAA